jgi:hypothetical protein
LPDIRYQIFTFDIGICKLFVTIIFKISYAIYNSKDCQISDIRYLLSKLEFVNYSSKLYTQGIRGLSDPIWWVSNPTNPADWIRSDISNIDPLTSAVSRRNPAVRYFRFRSVPTVRTAKIWPPDLVGSDMIRSYPTIGSYKYKLSHPVSSERIRPLESIWIPPLKSLFRIRTNAHIRLRIKHFFALSSKNWSTF